MRIKNEKERAESNGALFTKNADYRLVKMRMADEERVDYDNMNGDKKMEPLKSRPKGIFKSGTAEQAQAWHKVLDKSTFVLSGIGLLADVLGIGKLAYDVVVLGNLADIGFKLIVLVIVFLFGIGLGVVAIRGFQNISLPLMGRFYAWVYMTIGCLSYLGIAVTV